MTAASEGLRFDTEANLDAVHALATILHQRESAGQQRCGPGSTGCRMRHRMDATSVLGQVLASDTGRSVGALDVPDDVLDMAILDAAYAWGEDAGRRTERVRDFRKALAAYNAERQGES